MFISLNTSPTIKGLLASPNMWQTRIWNAAAVALLVGMMTYYAFDVKKKCDTPPSDPMTISPIIFENTCQQNIANKCPVEVNEPEGEEDQEIDGVNGS